MLQALRWHAVGDGLLDLSILWRNERERAQPLQALIDAFELKARACLAQWFAQLGARPPFQATVAING